MKSLRKRSLSILLSAVVVLASLAMFIPIVPATAAGTETFTLWEYLPKADTWQVLTNPGNTDLAPTVELDGRTLKVTSVHTGGYYWEGYPAGSNYVGVMVKPDASSPYMGDQSLAYWRTDPALMQAMSLSIHSNIQMTADGYSFFGMYLYNQGTAPVFGTSYDGAPYPAAAGYAIDFPANCGMGVNGYGWAGGLLPFNRALSDGPASTWDGNLLLSYSDRNDALRDRAFAQHTYDGFSVTTTKNVIVDDTGAFNIAVAGRKQNAAGVGYALAGEVVTLSLPEGTSVYNVAVKIDGSAVADLTHDPDTGVWTFPMPADGIVHVSGNTKSNFPDSYTLWQYVPGIDSEPAAWGNSVPVTNYGGWAYLGGGRAIVTGTQEGAVDFKQAATSYYETNKNVAFWRENQTLFEGMTVSAIYDFGKWEVPNNRAAHLGFTLTNDQWAFNVADGIGGYNPDRARSVTGEGYAEPGKALSIPVTGKAGTWNGTVSMSFGIGKAFNADLCTIVNGFKLITQKDVVTDASGLLNLTTTRKANAQGVAYAFTGETVTVSMAGGKALAGISATCNGEYVELEHVEGTTYRFTMPAGVVRFQVTEKMPETYTLWMYRPSADTEVINSSRGLASGGNFYGTTRLSGNGQESTYYLATTPSVSSPYASPSAAFWRTNPELFAGMNAAFTAEVVSGIHGADGLSYQPGIMSFQMIDIINAGWPAGTDNGALSGLSTAVSDMSTVYISPETTSYRIPFHMTGETWSGSTLTFMGNGGIENRHAARQLVNYKVTTTRDVVVDDSGAFLLSTSRKQDAEGVAFAFKNETVTLIPKAGQKVTGVTVTCGGKAVETAKSGSNYTFTMPEGIVHISADIAGDTDESFTLWEFRSESDPKVGWGNTAATAVNYYNKLWVNTSAGHETGFSLGTADNSPYSNTDIALWRNHADLFAAMELSMSAGIYTDQPATGTAGWLTLQLLNRHISYDQDGNVASDNFTWPGNVTNGDFSTGAPAASPTNVHASVGQRRYTIPVDNRTGTWNGMLVGWFGAGGSDNDKFGLQIDNLRITTKKDVVKDDSGALLMSTKYAADARDVAYALKGDTVTLKAREGVNVSNIRVLCGGTSIAVSDNGDGVFSFTMPEGIVHVTADSDSKTETFTLWEHNVNTDDHYVFGNADVTSTDRVNNGIPLDRGLVGGRLSIKGNAGHQSGWSNRLAADNPFETEPYRSFWKNNADLFEGMSLTLNADMASVKDAMLKVQLDNNLYYEWPISVDTGDYRDETGVGVPADPVYFLASAGRTRYSFPLTNTQGPWGGGLHFWFGAGGAANDNAEVQPAGYSVTTTKDVVVDDNGGLLISTDRLAKASGVAFAFAGETVVLETPASHIVKSIAVTCGGQPVTLNEDGAGTWSFTMPEGIVYIDADVAEYYQSTDRQSGVVIDDNDNVLINGASGVASVVTGQTVTVTAPAGKTLRYAEGTCAGQPVVFTKKDGSYTFMMPEGIVHLSFKVSALYDEFALWGSADGSNPPVMWENQDSPNDVQTGIVTDDEGQKGYKFTYAGDVRPNYSILKYDDSFLNDTPYSDWRTKIRLINAFNSADSAVLRFRAKVEKKSTAYNGATDLYMSFSNYDTEVWNGQYDISERVHVELTGEWKTYEIPLTAFKQKIEWNIGNMYLWNWPWADGDEVYITQMQIVTDQLVVTDDTESGGHVLFESTYHVETAGMTYGRADNEDEVFITPVADEGYAFKRVTATCNGVALDLERTDDGRYKFVMPEGIVRVNAEFTGGDPADPVTPPYNIATGEMTAAGIGCAAIACAAALLSAICLAGKKRRGKRNFESR